MFALFHRTAVTVIGECHSVLAARSIGHRISADYGSKSHDFLCENEPNRFPTNRSDHGPLWSWFCGDGRECILRAAVRRNEADPEIAKTPTDGM